jgi:AraC-like DNA-binding protein
MSRLSQQLSEINIELEQMVSTKQTRLGANERLLDDLFTLEVITHMFSIIRELPYRTATLQEVKTALDLNFIHDIFVLSVDQITQVCQILKSLGFETSPHFRDLWNSTSFRKRNGDTPVIKTGRDVPKLALQVRLADCIGVAVPSQVLHELSKPAGRFADLPPNNATSAAQSARTMPFDPAAISHMSKQDAEALRASLDNYLASFPPAQP